MIWYAARNTGFFLTLNYSTALIPILISAEDNDFAHAIPEENKIKKAVFSLNPHSSAGPDGFNGFFYQHTWNIIAFDIINAVQSFFLRADIPRACSTTLLALIPKIKNPSSFSKFSPISLCNVSNKILSKILARRLELILQKIISNNHSGFVLGRQIVDNIILAENSRTISVKKQGCKCTH